MLSLVMSVPPCIPVTISIRSGGGLGFVPGEFWPKNGQTVALY